MKDPITTPGKTYAVTSPNGCTVTQHVGEATIVHDVPAGVQVLIIAQAARMEVSDDAAVVTECGGSAELVFTAGVTQRASSSDSCTCEPYELTPEAIQQVVPMAWSEYTTPPSFTDSYNEQSVLIGGNVKGYSDCVIIGWNSSSSQNQAVGIGFGTKTRGFALALGYTAESEHSGVSLGAYTSSQEKGIAVGYYTRNSKKTSVAIGSKFTETTDSGNVTHTCTTEGTGSITIGAGANTLNNGDTESSNSVTIGCKAENKGADSVVIGAQAKATAGGTVAIGAGAEAADAGAVVIASYSTDRSYKTQLYFSGAGSALANTYANGEGIMGYVTTDSAGNVIASGYKKLSALFDEGSMTQPATLDEFGDWVMPKVFQPGKGEPQEYQPLPVYPIVEPEIPEMEEA